jgi:hypothetical protein
MQISSNHFYNHMPKETAVSGSSVFNDIMHRALNELPMDDLNANQQILKLSSVELAQLGSIKELLYATIQSPNDTLFNALLGAFAQLMNRLGESKRKIVVNELHHILNEWDNESPAKQRFQRTLHRFL